MKNKEPILFGLLALFTAVLAFSLARLDFFGFVSGAHTLALSYLFSAWFAWFTILLGLFFLDLEESPHKVPFFLVLSVLFGIVIAIVSRNSLASLSLPAAFFLFLFSSHTMLLRRQKLFVKFSFHDLLFPIVRSSFGILLLLLAFLSYSQALQKVNRSALVSPSILRTVSRPLIFILNKELSAQLSLQFNNQLAGFLPRSEKERITRFVLSKSLDSLTDRKTQAVFGFPREQIPIEKVDIAESGEIDLTPVFEGMYANLAKTLNERARQYLQLVPLVIGAITFFILSPLIALAEGVLFVFGFLIVQLLLKLGVLRIEKKNVEKEFLRL